MKREVLKTAFPPKNKPVLVWDGECRFCLFSVLRWKKITGDKIDYATFQEVNREYPDIPLEKFKKSIRLIEPDAKVFGGAEAVLRAFAYHRNLRWFYVIYRSFPFISKNAEKSYEFVSQHRRKLHRVTEILFGKDPHNLRHNWLFYFVIILALTLLLKKKER